MLNDIHIRWGRGLRENIILNTRPFKHASSVFGMMSLGSSTIILEVDISF